MLGAPLRKHLLIGTISAAVLGPVGLAVAAPCPPVRFRPVVTIPPR